MTEEKRAKTDGWISVADRLPLSQKDVVNYKTVDVIGCTRNNEVYNMEFAMGNTNGNQWHGFDDCVEGYVTHWMPLPDPPTTTKEPKQ